MKALPPSIFNDVIGPVMRGPSSSHCAAAVRIGRMARDLMGGDLTNVRVAFHPSGSLATTHQSQGSDMGLFGGLLGWEATDERLVRSEDAIREAGIVVEIGVEDFPAFHPNTYRLTLTGSATVHRLIALSTGGGMIRVVELDGIPLEMEGDYQETLAFLPEGEAAGPVVDRIEAGLRGVADEAVDEVLLNQGSEGPAILQIRSRAPLGEGARELLAEMLPEREIRAVSPVLPVGSRKGMEVPFLTAAEMERHARHRIAEQERPRHLWELAVEYESARSGLSAAEVLNRMESIVDLLEGSIEAGLKGTRYADRILPPQAGIMADKMREGRLLGSGLLNRVVLYVTAMMEVKSAMGVIVAAPTAGACGALPGACLATAHELGFSSGEVARAMLAAGVVGVFIAARSTFAAEVCGCQAECGAGSGMTAAALVTLGGGSAGQALAAASMALQNTLGMICDPVANRVEVPCLGRNVLAATNGLACANMGLAGFDPVIPLDEVIATMDDVGKSIPRALRCTALGGLAITPAARAIQKRLEEGPSLHAPGPTETDRSGSHVKRR